MGATKLCPSPPSRFENPHGPEPRAHAPEDELGNDVHDELVPLGRAGLRRQEDGAHLRRASAAIRQKSYLSALLAESAAEGLGMGKVFEIRGTSPNVRNECFCPQDFDHAIEKYI